MHKFIFLLFGLLIIQHLFSQNNLPVIQATSTSVDIRISNEYFAKGGWILEPDKRPDVFLIGSKWNYKSKEVTFVTNIDSITFNVQPGHTYDFIIILNGKISCYTQIKTRANLFFLKKRILIPVLSGFIIILMALYFITGEHKIKRYLQLGYFAVALFWLMTFVSGYLHKDYNHLKNTISELGAIETVPEIITSCSLVFISLLLIIFSLGFFKESNNNNLSVLPAVLSFSMPVAFAWSGMFPLGNEFHSAAGPFPLLSIVGSLLAYLLWKKGKEFFRIRILSLFAFLLMILILLRFIPAFENRIEGLVQRLFYAGWTLWTISIAYCFIRTKRKI